MSYYNPQGMQQPSNDLLQLQREMDAMRQRLSALETMAGRQPMQTSGMMSPSFMTRAFSVWGHYFVAQLIIGLIILFVVLLFSLLFGGIFGGILGGF